MLSEDYCECPRCRYKKATTRSGSMGWLQFVGCPKCGFVEINSPYPEHNTKNTKKMILKTLRTENLRILKLTDFMGDKKWK
jgi:hypothetical protein